MALLGLLLLATGSVSMPLHGQDRSRFWLGAGAGGAGGGNSTGGGALMAQIVYQTNAHQFTVRAMGAADPFGNGGDEFGEIGVLYGRAAKRRWGHAAISTGLAWTGFGSCADNAGAGCSTLGLPIVAEASARLFSIMGVGAQAFANLNVKSIYGGVVVFLQLGWLP
jgi:hypothetical protein